MSGPVPKRESELARPRSRKGAEQQPVTKGVMRPVSIPRADPKWHKIAKMFWESLKKSGQSDFYQQSDWAFAYSLADDLSAYKEATWANGDAKRSPEMLKALLQGMERLLVAEGDRRRVRVELHEPPDESESASVLAIADYKKDLGVE